LFGKVFLGMNQCVQPPGSYQETALMKTKLGLQVLIAVGCGQSKREREITAEYKLSSGVLEMMQALSITCLHLLFEPRNTHRAHSSNILGVSCWHYWNIRLYHNQATQTRYACQN
jgi:hypothetical protein